MWSQCRQVFFLFSFYLLPVLNYNTNIRYANYVNIQYANYLVLSGPGIILTFLPSIPPPFLTSSFSLLFILSEDIAKAGLQLLVSNNLPVLVSGVVGTRDTWDHICLLGSNSEKVFISGYWQKCRLFLSRTLVCQGQGHCLTLVHPISTATLRLGVRYRQSSKPQGGCHREAVTTDTRAVTRQGTLFSLKEQL